MTSDENRRAQPVHIKLESFFVTFYQRLVEPEVKQKFQLLKEPLFIDGKLNTKHY
jgi:hypothetical protein